MAKPLRGTIDRLMHRRMLRRWSGVARNAANLDLTDLRGLRGMARELRAQIDALLFVAEGRLALPVVGPNPIQKPLHTDWAWRPEFWRGPMQARGMTAVDSRTEYGNELKVFHDCTQSELTLRQVRNIRESDLAPYGLRMDVFRFDGSFLSLVIEIPKEAVNGLSRRHIMRVAAVVEVERPLEIFARLNVKHGPNTEQVVRELPITDDEVIVDFDLAYTKLNEKRVEKMWLDLIFEGAEMNQITLRDVAFTRRPRADL
ncbi:DUF6478 family protein [Anianabacter salinae]|uniref:DUF6478 family protein n=1 Tax=Anianabacter salinae TaxID=2851023 RepID=UPI00225DCFD8|nr:DUF6478 family protein [Anianabacter salinae]MBV0913317.1 hypothetical protein [Anianabacter salinae]